MTETPPPLVPGPEPQVPPRPTGWTRGLLIVSLTLNLIIVGIIGGAALRHSGSGARPADVRELSFGPFTAALSPEDRAELRRSFLTGGHDLRGMRHGARAEFEELFLALRAEPFQLEAVAAVMQRQAARLTEGIGLGQDLLLQRIGQMTAEERAGFADRLEQSVRRGPGRRDGGN